ncbi:hypothetical protein KP003_03360 [Geomonas nitrogeniifigens]|uniref:Fibronectin type-III domain-containing protein n=1 Tax=Geomonas diazotrophica TaxID=2843197 RepID=A0ABX8JIQ0_9BACT|nr:hypothetical protein [Geomonas nitrogeniifigens]QWV98269.1 hypothetical protein KP005_02995 [Geomonas nitrogeniifigens]QXE87453.1 hypothetical protein KP003_03360 [Geomonas nitrogeniifigens]
MCIPWKRHIAAALLLICLPLLVIGCGGGGGGGGTRTISGVATKGPIVGGLISVYRLTTAGARGALIGSGTTGADGNYAVKIPASVTGPVVVTVTGQPGATYLSETTGQQVPFTAAESFSAAVDNFNPAVPVTVSPLTEAAFEKLPLILAQKPGTITTEVLQSSVVAANNQVGDLFNVTDILAPPAGNAAYVAALTVIDQMIVDSKATGSVTDTTAVTTIINQAVADVSTSAPAYQTFAQLFTISATEAVAADPSLTTVVGNLTQSVTNPPAEPNFSDVTAPSVVTGLTATTYALNATTSAVVLNWNPSTDNIAVAGYDIYRDGGKVGSSTTTSFTDPAVTPNVTYSYTVVAFDAAGNFAAASAPLSVKPNQTSLNVTVSGSLSSDLLSRLDILAPTAPTSLTAVTTALTGTTSSVALSWAAATDTVGVTGYEVYRDGVKLATVASTSYTDPSVTSAITYAYTVKAFDAAGNRSDFSTALSVTPNRPSLGVTVSGQVNTGP